MYVCSFHPPSLLPVQTVQQRGAAVLKARKLSSAMSASKAVSDHFRDWWFGTAEVEEHSKREGLQWNLSN